MLELFKIKPFRRFFLSLFIFHSGGWIYQVGVSVLVYQLTGSALSVLLINIAQRTPSVILGLFGGYVADHRDKRQILFLCHLLYSLIIIAVFFVDSAQDVWIIYAVGFMISIIGSIARPCRFAAVVDVVDQARLEKANTLLRPLENITMIFSAPLAGILYPVFGIKFLLAINIVSGLVSAFLIFSIYEIATTKQSGTEYSFTKKLLGGWHKIFEVEELKRLFIYNILMTIPLCAQSLILNVYPIKIFNWGSVGVGIFNSLYGVATLMAIFIVARLTKKTNTNKETLRPILLIANGVVWIALSFSTSRMIGAVLFLTSIVLFMVFFIHQENMKVIYAGKQYVGRVSAVDLMAQVVILMIFNLLYGKMGDLWGVHYVGMIAGALLITFPLLYEIYLKLTSLKVVVGNKAVFYED